MPRFRQEARGRTRTEEAAGRPVSGAAEPSVDSVSRFLRFFNLGDAWWADRCLQSWIESARMGKNVLHLFRLISPSNVPSPVTLPPGAKSIVSNSIIVNVPVVPANRPVPFSIVATFVSLALFGGMKTP